MYQKIFEHLELIASQRLVTTYGEIANVAGVIARSSELFRVLTDISAQEHVRGRPLLSVVVVTKERNLPGPGFFTLARELGLYSGDSRSEEIVFFAGELLRVHDVWSAPVGQRPVRTRFREAV